MEIINKRYKVIKKINANAVGEMFEVIDLIESNNHMNLTIFNAEYSDEIFVRSLIKDFRFYESVKHGFLSEIYEFETLNIVDDKKINRVQYLYTYEKVETENLVNYVDLTREDSRQILSQICMLIEFLHFRGIVYRYLNMDNILILKEDGKVKLKLKNLVYVNTYSDIVNLNSSNSTMFIAPEVLWDDNYIYSSDVYSLGYVIFYLYYRYDINKYSISEVFDSKSDNEVYSLIRKMTSSFINDRYDLLENVFSELRSLLRLKIDMSDIEYYNQIHMNTRLIGREKEIKTVYREVSDKFENNIQRRSTLFYGEKGVGKSRLIQEIAFRMRYHGDHIIHINAQEGSEPFVNFKKIIEKMIIEYSVSSDLIQKYGNEIAKLIPSLAKKWSIKLAEVLETDKENLKLSNRIYNFIAEYTQNSELIILIDNIENLSEYELNVIGYLLRNQTETKLYIVGSSKQEFLDTLTFKKWIKTNNIKPMALSKFNYDDANEYVKEILGMNKKPINFTAQIMKELNGNPRLIKNVIQNLFLTEKIYINDKKKWFIKELDNMSDINFNEEIEENVHSQIQSLSEDEFKLMQLISIFEIPVRSSILMSILEMNNLDLLLKKLSTNGLIAERFGDWGYTYNIESKTIRKMILESIDIRDRISYHSQSADIIENEVMVNKSLVSEELIYHLINSNQFEKAAKFCVFAGDQMIDYNIHSQALKYFEKAIEIYESKNNVEKIPKILLKIGNLISIVGEYEKAISKYKQALDIVGENEEDIVVIDLKNKMSNIYVLQNKLNLAEQILIDNIATAKKIQYLTGEFDSAIELCKVYMVKDNLGEFYDLVNIYLSLSESLQNKFYIAKFLNELGKHEFMSENEDRALKNFNKSYDLFIELGENFEATKPYNNIGAVYLELHGENKKSRRYFKEIIKTLDGLNIPDGREAYYQNIGESYLGEDNYLKATHFLNKARQLAEKSGNTTTLFGILLLQCRLFIRLGEYDKAHILIKKMQLEYNLSENKQSFVKDYHIVHVEYFIKTKNFEMAEMWIVEYIQFSDNKKRFNNKIIKNYSMTIDYNKRNYLNLEKNIDKAEILSYINSLENLNDCRFFRETLLDIAKGFANSQKYILVQKILDLDSALRTRVDTPMIEAKRLILEGILKDDRINYYIYLIEESSDDIVREDLWFLYKQLGDEYYFKDDYYKAANCYLTSLDIVKQLTLKLSSEHRSNYLIHDESKIELKNRINSLRRKILGKNDSEEKLLFNELEYNSTENYFDFSIIGDLLENNKFIDSVYNSFKLKYGIKLETVDKLVSLFTSEEKDNIYLALLYLVQKTVGDRGFVFLLDDDSNVSDVIKTDNSSIAPDINSFIKNTGCDEKGIFINDLNSSENRYALLKDQKALIVMPIKKNMSNLNDLGRRRKENFINREKIVGYIYIESSRVFNNICKENFELTKSIIKMMNIMIDNYNLKQISTNDKLTGVYLRKYIEDVFPFELNNARVSGENMSVVMCDIDKFKNINDIYGHRKGDEILRGIGHILKTQLRKSDYVGRYGGEEFIILLPDTDKDLAYEVCEKLRVCIKENTEIGENKPITLSFGISTYPDYGLSEDELIERADQALYYSKNNGRNRTTIWNAGIGQDNSRFDKLAGILTGNISTDTRTIQSVVNILSVSNDKIDKVSKLESMIKNILDITDAKQCSIIKFRNNDISEIYTRERGVEEWLGKESLNIDLVNMFRYKENGDFFINWNDISEFDDESSTPNWNSCIVVPLYDGEIEKGQIIITVPIKDREFDFSSFNFVNSIKSVIGLIL
ncbi:MAG: diguanylate cyclase [Acidaminobacteraceae bacterium]